MKVERTTMMLFIAFACSLTGCASMDPPVRRDDTLYLKPGEPTQHEVIAARVTPASFCVDSISLVCSPVKQQPARSI